MREFLAIGEVAAASGVSRDAIRYYERLGLLPRVARTAAGYRQYPAAILTRLALVRNAQRFGFSLRELAGFLRVRDGGGAPCHHVRAAGARRLKEVDDQIAQLRATRNEMRATLRTWDCTLGATDPGRPALLLEALKGSSTRTTGRLPRRR